MSDENYRSELRNHYMEQKKNGMFQSTSQGYRRNSFNAQQKMDDCESAYNTHRRQTLQQTQQTHASPANSIKHGNIRPTNGDGDHFQMSHIPQFNSGGANGGGPMLYPSITIGNGGGSNCGESCRHSDTFSVRHRSSKGKDQSTQLTPMQMKYQDDSPYLYETDSNIELPRPSDESSRSMKSSKTVVSKKSSRDLRKIVKSQCRLHEVIDNTLKQMCQNEDSNVPENESEKYKIKDNSILGMENQIPVHTHCKRCADKLWLRSSHHDLPADIADEVVNSKVINPMVRKLQRMYLNNLREEMSLMEDLERLPHKVNEVYKAAIYKHRE